MIAAGVLCVLVASAVADGDLVARAGPAVSAGDERDVASKLERLRASTSAERAAAQQWLARNLAASDHDFVRAAILSGDAESRRRLSEALADDERHVALAVRLAAASEAPLAEVGRRALAEAVARWSRGSARPGLSRRETLAKLEGQVEVVLDLDTRARDGHLDLALDSIARLVPGSPPLVLDPGLALDKWPRETQERLEAPFVRALDELARIHHAELTGYGFDDDLEGQARRWILFRRSDEPAGRGAEPAGSGAEFRGRSAVDRVIDWCLGVAGAGEDDLRRRSACARALAATRWPAGIAWLEERWIAGKDEAALDGVMLAAGRGQVAPALARPEVQRELYALARNELARGLREPRYRIDAIGRALAAAGPRGPAGESLQVIAVAGWADLPPRERALRLLVLEGQRGAASSELRTLLVDSIGTSPPEIVFLTLRVLAASGAQPAPSIGDIDAPFFWASDAGCVDECVRLLRALGRQPSKGTGYSREPGQGGSEWTLLSGEPETAAGELASLVARGPEVREKLAARARLWIREGLRPRLDEITALARAQSDTAAFAFDRFEVLAGIGDEVVRARLFGRALAREDKREDLLVLGALAAGAHGVEARAALVRAISGPGGAPDLLDALDRAVQELRAARLEQEEGEFVEAVRRASRDASAAVRERLRFDSWPARQRPPALRLRELERSLEDLGV